ncbi:MAG: L,D-transpeptidase [Sandaracinaceae bacterium]
MAPPRISGRPAIRPIAALGPAIALTLLAAPVPGDPARAQRLPVPSGARSVEVVRPGATVRVGPARSSPRRGTVRVGTRLPLWSRHLGEGCPGGEWIRVGQEAFVCETLTRLSAEPPGGDPVPSVPEGQLTPRHHAFVRTDGTWAYARPSDLVADRWVETLGAGFGVAVVERRSVRGVELARTLSGLWVPVSELVFARPSDFTGVELGPDADLARLGWVIGERARPRGTRDVIDRLTPVEVEAWGRRWVELADGRELPRRHLTGPRLAAPPPEAMPGRRWIDVDLDRQVLVAYVGPRPVFATLVSTGRRPTSTPRGTFRVWVKLAESDMDDLERDDVVENYAIQAVPWVQFFEGSVALHAAFWHDRFGHRRSHGCVNLAPRDAERLFAFTRPALPAGWDAILPTERSPGTVVRVR